MKNSKVFLFIFFILYLFITLFFFRGVIFSHGAIVGGDWSLPITGSQMLRYAKGGLYYWSDRSLFGVEQYFINGNPFGALIAFMAKIGITGYIYHKALLVFSFVFAACTMCWFLLFLGCKKWVAFFSGFLYITLPFFFNYAIMGWLFVLFAMGILPLALIFFIKSVKDNNILYSIFTGVLYYIAMIQSQSLFWFPLAFFMLSFYLIDNKKSFYLYCKSFFIILLVFLGMNACLWLPIFFSGSSGVLSTQLGLSSASLGTWARLSALNILRGWGSLFNYSYETSYPKTIFPLSFVLPILAYSSLIFLKNKKIVYSFTLLSFVSIALYKLGPSGVGIIPFSDIIRDIARFSIISIFSYVVLAALVLHFMFEHPMRRFRAAACILCVLLIVKTYPFFNGALWAEQTVGYDIRLRTYAYPQGYFSLEDFLSNDKGQFKVFYIPMGGGIRIAQDKKFDDLFESLRDVFPPFGPKAGDAGFTDKRMGTATDLMYELEKIQNTQNFDDLPRMLGFLGVRYLAVKKDVAYINDLDPSNPPSGDRIVSLLKKVSGLSLKRDWGSVALFENKSFLPYIYTPQDVIVLDKNIESMRNVLSQGNYKMRSVMYFSGSDVVDTDQNLSVMSESIENNPGLEFKKINPTKYVVRIHRASGDFPLVFSEGFHNEWKIYLSDNFKIDTQREKRYIPGSSEGALNNDEFSQYVDQGLVSTFGKKEQQDFISKNIQGTIQNNNIPAGRFYETYFKESLFKDNHAVANGYANSWLIRLDEIKKSGKYIHNSDGSIDFEVIIDFWPQRLFCIGVMISGFTLFCIIGYGVLRIAKKKRSPFKIIL